MRKVVLTFGLLALLTATPVIYAKDHGNDSGPHGPGSKNDESSETSSCDPAGNYKNHGQYVSCVAKEHQGGEEVEEAAHSDVGKHQSPSPTVSPSLTPSPSVSPSASASASPTASSSATPSLSPSPSASESASPSASPTLQLGILETTHLKVIINTLESLLEQLEKII